MASIATEESHHLPAPKGRPPGILSLDMSPGGYGDQENIMTENPTPEEIVEVAKSGSTGMVKTLSDIRMDKMAQEIAELKAGYQAVIKENEELRKANQELYSFAAQVSHPENQAAQAGDFTLNSPTAQPVAAAPINAEAEAAAQKAKEDSMLSAVLTQMGYKKTTQSNIDNTPKDGM